jgi:DNA modification methylase
VTTTAHSAAGTATVLRADTRHIPLPDDSVDLIVTSPPYFAQRSYKDGGQHYSGQIGDEATPQEYIAALGECTREWARVLKPTGSIFVNLGDKYAERTGPARRGYVDDDEVLSRPADRPARGRRGTIPVKSLMLLPERYRIACVDELGLIARAVLAWSKTNGKPESMKDRVRRSHEDWLHLTKRPRYYSATDEIREESTPQRGLAGTFRRHSPSDPLVPGQNATQHRADRPDVPGYNPLGKLPGSVWEIPTQPLRVPDHISHARCCDGLKRDGCEDGVKHHAAFPMEWPRRLILGWSPSGICTACGEGRRPLIVTQRTLDGAAVDLGAWQRGGISPAAGVGNWRFGTDRRILGEVCACPNVSAPTRPAVVLDPFGGTGTVALVAKALGRHGITVDMSADYCLLAGWRTTDPGQLAKASRGRRRPKPRRPRGQQTPAQASTRAPAAARQVEGQEALFAMPA